MRYFVASVRLTTLNKFWVKIARAVTRREFFIAIARAHTHICTRLISQLFPTAKVASRTCSDLMSLDIRSYLRNSFYERYTACCSWNTRCFLLIPNISFSVDAYFACSCNAPYNFLAIKNVCISFLHPESRVNNF